MIVASMKRFHEYIYGHHFDLITDHKPLLALLSGDRQMLQVLSPHMSQLTVFLTAYAYPLFHQSGKHLCHTDALSHCQLLNIIEDPPPATSVLLINVLQVQVTAADIAKHSARDKVIAQVLVWVRRGWPKGTVTPEFHPFKIR